MVGVQRGRGFVGDDQLGLPDQSSRGGNPLLLANAEIEDALIEESSDTEAVRHVVCCLPEAPIPEPCHPSPVKPAREGDIVGDAQIRNQIEHLKDESDVLSPESVPLRSGQQSQILTEHIHHTGLSREHARKNTEKRSLAGAARSVQKDLFSPGYFEPRNLQCVVTAPVTESDILELNGGCHCSFNSSTPVPLIVKATSP
jgi:hypothetical protein